MTRILVSALRLIVGLGVMLFSAFAVAATVLIFFAWQGNVLAWDNGGPCWQFAMIAIACFLASRLWLMLWHRLHSRKRRRTKQRLPQRLPLTVASGTPGPMTAIINTMN